MWCLYAACSEGEEVMEKLLADLKKGLADVDKKSIEKLKNSKDTESRKLAAILQKKLDDDTGMMLQVSPGYGRRIGSSGKAEGPILEKAPSGLYISEKEIEDEKKREARRGTTKKMAVGGMSTKMTPKQQTKVGKVMKEFKSGSLHSGKGGKVVTKPRQAVAIAISEARRMKKK